MSQLVRSIKQGADSAWIAVVYALGDTRSAIASYSPRGFTMRLFHILRAHPRVSLAAALLLALPMIFWLLGVGSARAKIPWCSNLRYEERPCSMVLRIANVGIMARGKAAQTRISRFETSGLTRGGAALINVALDRAGLLIEVTYREHQERVWYGTDRPINV